MKNALYFGDNLDVMRSKIGTETIDLIYADPPFNSNRTYNVLYRDEGGNSSEAQIMAFEDTWSWGPSAEQTFNEIVNGTGSSPHVANMIGSMRGFIGDNSTMAYLVMMTARLQECHRILKPTGSLYLHCDPSASHYLKIILDTIFDAKNFRNEITWKRTQAHASARKKFESVTDTILFYTKTGDYTFNIQYSPLSQSTVAECYRHDDGDGRGPYQLVYAGARSRTVYNGFVWNGNQAPPRGWRYKKETLDQMLQDKRIVCNNGSQPRVKMYLDESKGKSVDNLWCDIDRLGSASSERLGYPTQKPVELIDRIIKASSNPGDVVLDPFCGGGTTLVSAHGLGRHWIGIDVTHLSVSLVEYRLKEKFELRPGRGYDLHGEPKDMTEVHKMITDDPTRYQFQWWALSLVNARPAGAALGSNTGKKGADQGIDGLCFFMDAKSKPEKVIVQVKSGSVNSAQIRDLVGTVQREGAAMGVFLTLEDPTQPMIAEALAAGYYHSPLFNTDHQKIQILTIADLLSGNSEIDMPSTSTTLTRQPKQIVTIDQPSLFDWYAKA